MISKFRRNLYSFGQVWYTADTNANIARGAQHAKEMEGRGKEAHREGAV